MYPWGVMDTNYTQCPEFRPLLWQCVSQLIPVPDPLPVGVVEPVGQPLRLQQLVPLGVQEQWFASPENNKNY